MCPKSWALQNRAMTLKILATRFKTPYGLYTVFVSHKIKQDLILHETKLPVVNEQCLVYKFECDLCNPRYVGFTCQHLHVYQRIEEHKNPSSSIG